MTTLIILLALVSAYLFVLWLNRDKADVSQLSDNDLLMENHFHWSTKNIYIKEYLRRHPEKK